MSTVADTLPEATTAPRRALYATLGAASRWSRAMFRLLVATAITGVVLHAHESPYGTVATAVHVGALAYALVTLVLVGRRPVRRDSDRMDIVVAIADVLVVTAVAASVNDPRTTVLLFLCAVPVGHGLVLSASSVAAVTAAAISAAVALWAFGLLAGAGGLDDGSLLLVAFALGWCGLVACLIAVERERRAERITKLSVSVRTMLHQAMHAEEHERTRVADLLHDDVLQLLLVTRHDISDAIAGDLELLPDARSSLEAATHRLRETIATLRDDGIGARPIGEAVQGLADDTRSRRGIAVAVSIDPLLKDVRLPVVVSVVRDLLRSAETASAASAVHLSVLAAPGRIELAVRHDDRRFALGLGVSEHDEELARDVADRVRAVDGLYAVERSPSGDRAVRITFPLPTHDQQLALRPPAPAPVLSASILEHR